MIVNILEAIFMTCKFSFMGVDAECWFSFCKLYFLQNWHFGKKVAAGWLAPTQDTHSPLFLSQLFSLERFAFDVLSWFCIHTKSLHLSTFICCFNTYPGRTVEALWSKVDLISGCPSPPPGWPQLNTQLSWFAFGFLYTDQGQSVYPIPGGHSPPPCWPCLPSPGGSLPQKQATHTELWEDCETATLIVTIWYCWLWTELNLVRTQSWLTGQNFSQDYANDFDRCQSVPDCPAVSNEKKICFLVEQGSQGRWKWKIATGLGMVSSSYGMQPNTLWAKLM